MWQEDTRAERESSHEWERVDPKLAETGLRTNTGSAAERTLLTMRTHPKVLFGPTLVGLVMVAGSFACVTYVPRDLADGKAWWAGSLLCLLGALILAGVPVLRWWAERYVLTTHRVKTKKGIIWISGRAIAISRITDVNYEQGLLDRIFGCGTLVITEPSSRDGVKFKDIPRVNAVKEKIHDLMIHHHPPAQGFPHQTGE